MENQLAKLIGTSPERGIAGMATGTAFIVSCVLGAGMIASCEFRAKEANQCGAAYWDAGKLILGGGALRVAFEGGFQTWNPKLRSDGEPVAELPQIEGPGPEPEPEFEFELDPRQGSIGDPEL